MNDEALALATDFRAHAIGDPALALRFFAQDWEAFAQSRREPTTLGAVVLAVSGGGDSMALLHAFAEAGERFGPPPRTVVATVDHGLREASAREAETVATAAAGLGFEHRTLPGAIEGRTSGVQANARHARLAALRQLAMSLGPCAAILTAHTADDAAETLAMREARTGPDHSDGGLAPWAWLHGCWLYRPFMHQRRAAMRDWLAKRDLRWTDDPGNADDRFERTRVRRRLADHGTALALIRRNRELARLRGSIAAEAVRLYDERIVYLTTGGTAVMEEPLRHASVPAGMLVIRTALAFVGRTRHRPASCKTEAALIRTFETGAASLNLCVLRGGPDRILIEPEPSRAGGGDGSRRRIASVWGEPVLDDWCFGRLPGIAPGANAHGRSSPHIPCLAPYAQIVPAQEWQLANALHRAVVGAWLPIAPVPSFWP